MAAKSRLVRETGQPIRGREDPDLDLLRLTLATAVPLRIAEMQRIGGPTRTDWKFARETGQELSNKGDVLLFGSKKPGEVRELIGHLISAIAVMAFIPGGCNVLGMHFEP